MNWRIIALQYFVGFCHTSTWISYRYTYAAAKSLQSCPTLCDPRDSSPPGSPFPGILQARTLEWVAVSFSNAWKWKVKVKSLSHSRLLSTPWTAAYQAPLSMDFPGKSTGVGCHCLLRGIHMSLLNQHFIGQAAWGKMWVWVQILGRVFVLTFWYFY